METETEMDVLINSSVWKVVFKDTSPVIIQISRIFKHQLTHQQIFAKFITISTEKNLSETFNDFLYVNLKNLADYPVPRLIEQYLSENGFLN